MVQQITPFDLSDRTRLFLSPWLAELLTKIAHELNPPLNRFLKSLFVNSGMQKGGLDFYRPWIARFFCSYDTSMTMPALI